MMRRFHSGFTLIDLFGLLLVTAALIAVVLPSVAARDTVVRSLSCADNLRSLTVAANQRAADHDGNFFVQKNYPAEIAWGPNAGSPVAWWDEGQVGQYIRGLRPIEWRSPVVINGKEDLRPFGLGGDPLTCSETNNEVRSYDMNYWASGANVPFKPQPVLHEDRLRDLREQPGDFFDAHAAGDMSKRLLFGEALALGQTPADEEGKQVWATGWSFGRRFLPGQRFGAVPKVLAPAAPDISVRWNQQAWPTQFDYGRHGGERGNWPEAGTANFAFVDGHVGLLEAQELYEPDSMRSTNVVEWTFNDRLIEDLVLEH